MLRGQGLHHFNGSVSEERMRTIGVLCVAALVTVASSALAKNKEVSLQDKQQAACYDDVNKFCKDAMPDVDRVTACMKDKKSVVSAKCAAMWDVKQ
jgi:hypothetical protein